MLALLFEADDRSSAGKKIILNMNKESDELPVFRAGVHSLASRGWNLNSPMTLVVISRYGEILERLEVNGFGQSEDLLTNALKKHLSERNGDEEELSATTTSTQVTVALPDTSIDIATPDIVFAGDLEKAVEYSITKGVALQTVLDAQKLQSLYYYIETLLSFFPNMRTPMRNFLTSLKEWPVLMGFSSISNTDYKRKVKELSEHYHPFALTPEEWQGCQGSESHFRGYPCSLWTLFHALSVSASTHDPSFQYGGVSTVANAMISYISTFFSCRECAQHFNEHIREVGHLPHTGDQSILWVWTIHNMANKMLAGDHTEDPTSPKIQWPSPLNCPSCRTRRTRRNTYFDVWDRVEVLKYIKTVYNKDRIKDTLKLENSLSTNVIGKVLEELKNTVRSDDTEVFQEAREKIVNHCRKE